MIPRHTKIEYLKNLRNMRPSPGCQWCVYAYLLNNDIIGSNGKVDDLYGVSIPLGSFETEKEADDHAKTIIERTGYNVIIVSKYGHAIKLTNKLENGIPVYLNNKEIMEMDNKQFQSEINQYEHSVKRFNEINTELEQEADTSTMEYLKLMFIKAISEYASVKTYEQMMKNAQRNYNMRKKLIQEHVLQYPDHKSGWINLLKEKLSERQETSYLESILSGYEKIKDDVYSDI